MADNDKQRNFVRVNNVFDVRIVKDNISDSSNLELEAGKSINVSGSGLLINTNEKLEAGDLLNITFMKPNTFDFFKGKGEVVRVVKEGNDSYQIAVNFINLNPDDMKALDYYIKLGK